MNVEELEIVVSVMSNLAAIVRIHEGNRCPQVNKLLELTDQLIKDLNTEICELVISGNS